MCAPLVHELVVDELVAVTRAGGLVAGLRRIVDCGQPVPCSGSGRTLVPAGAAGRVAAWQVAGAELAAHQADIRVLPHPLAGTEELELIEVRAAQPDAGRPASDSLLVNALLVAVRLGLIAAMLDLAVCHLRGRQVEGLPLTHKQLPQSAIADALACAELCRYAVLTAVSATALDALHTRLGMTGWSLTALFGGSGYLRSHPARCLYVAELVRDAWVMPVTSDSEGDGARRLRG